MQAPRPDFRISGDDLLSTIVDTFRGTDDFNDFRVGLGYGEEGAARHALRVQTAADFVLSPIEAVAGQPAWDGSNLRTHNLATSIGAVVGAFAYRKGLDVNTIIDPRLQGEQHEI